MKKRSRIAVCACSEMEGFSSGHSYRGSAELSRKPPRRHDAPDDARLKRNPDLSSGLHTHIDRRFADGRVTKGRLVRASVVLAGFRGD